MWRTNNNHDITFEFLVPKILVGCCECDSLHNPVNCYGCFHSFYLFFAMNIVFSTSKSPPLFDLPYSTLCEEPNNMSHGRYEDGKWGKDLMKREQISHLVGKYFSYLVRSRLMCRDGSHVRMWQNKDSTVLRYFWETRFPYVSLHRWVTFLTWCISCIFHFVSLRS